MGKARRKMRPQPPRWWTLDNDNCWFCKNRNNSAYVRQFAGIYRPARTGGRVGTEKELY